MRIAEVNKNYKLGGNIFHFFFERVIFFLYLAKILNKHILTLRQEQ